MKFPLKLYVPNFSEPNPEKEKCSRRARGEASEQKWAHAGFRIFLARPFLGAFY